MPDIRLFVSCHKNYYVPKNGILYPVQVGAALTGERFPGMERDDMGDGISHKNRFYCELTAQYWAWKNAQADYYGFFHYRRYLSFRKEPVPHKQLGQRLPKPYYSRRVPTQKVMEEAGYGNLEALERVISGWDIIAPLPEKMYVPVYRHYDQAPHHHIRDLDLAVEVLGELYPDYSDAAKAYLANDRMYFGNIFVMKKELFFPYCQWLFSILEVYDARKDTTGYTAQALRVDGYLAERLLGIYLLHTAEQGVKLCHVPRLHFECMENHAGYLKKKAGNFLLPPGSKRRSMVKRAIKK